MSRVEAGDPRPAQVVQVQLEALIIARTSEKGHIAFPLDGEGFFTDLTLAELRGWLVLTRGSMKKASGAGSLATSPTTALLLHQGTKELPRLPNPLHQELDA